MKGNFHFRFKSSLIPGGETYGKGNDMAVWMDCVDNAKPVPYWRNTIIAKVTRISMDYVGDEEDELPHQMHSNGVHHHTTTTPTVSTPTATPHVQTHTHTPTTATDTENLLNVFDNPTPVPAPVPVAASTPPSNLFDMDHPNTTQTSSSTGSLLDMDVPHPTPSVSVTSSNPNSDLLGMSMPSAAPTQPLPHHHHHAPPPPQPPHAQPSPQQPQLYSSMPNQPVNIPTPVPVSGGMPQRMSGTSSKGSNRPKINGFDSFAEKQGPFGNLNWS